jgi:hypothetical protein
MPEINDHKLPLGIQLRARVKGGVHSRAIITYQRHVE